MSRTLNGVESVPSTATGLELSNISRDTATVIALLADSRFSFSLLTGHSKGNLVISEALYALERRPAGKPIPADKFWIVTVSAAVAMPKRYKKIIDVMGTIDGLGKLNSSPGIAVEKPCPLSWHHTNTEIAFHLPVTKVFRELTSERGLSL